MKSGYENICFFFDYVLLIFGYLWHDIDAKDERRRFI